MKTQKIDIRKFSKMTLLRNLPQSTHGALERIAEELIRRELEFRKTIEDALAGIELDERLGYPTATVTINAPLALVQCGLENQRRALKYVLDALEKVNGVE
jgi:hypothetical protein